jgi:membrane protease YdiL (CAAX protease family)
MNETTPVPSEMPATPTFHQPRANPIFFGRFGFRAGFGIAIFLIVAWVLTMVGGFAGLLASGQAHKAMEIYSKTHSAAAIGRQIVFKASLIIGSDGFQFLGLLGFCWLVSRAERRPFHYYGIGHSRFRDVIPGAIWGIVSMSGLVFLLKARGLLVFDGVNLHGAAPILGYGLYWLLAFILVGFFEEYVFRGYMLYTLTRGFWGLGEKLSPANPQAASFWLAAVVMSLIFGGLHMNNPGENALGIFQVVFVGIVFCYALYRTGSLWWGIGFHALWDFMQSFTFGVPDSGNVSVGRLFITHPAGNKLLSGGTDGPEGSIFSAVFVFLTLFAIYFTTKPGIHPLPQQLPKPEDVLPVESTSLTA